MGDLITRRYGLQYIKMSDLYDENYIQHHGIKGQKWGVRNGPPYPLDYRTKRDKNLGRKVGMSWLKSDFDNTYRERTKVGFNDGHVEVWDSAKRAEDLLNNHKGEVCSFSINGKPIGQRRFLDETDAGINDMSMPGQTNNCCDVTVCAELRSRGLNCKPGRSFFGTNEDAMKHYFPGCDFHKGLSLDETLSIFDNYPIGSSGSIAGRHDPEKLGLSVKEDVGGHIMHWEKHEDSIHFTDLQPKYGDFYSDINSMIGGQKFKNDSFNVSRLDNIEPDWNLLAEDSVIRFETPGFRNENSMFNLELNRYATPNKVTNEENGNVSVNWRHNDDFWR